MIDLLMSNLQGAMVVGAALLSGVYILTGFTRVTAEDGETSIKYTEGRLRRNIAVAGVLGALALSLAIVPKGYEGVVYDLDGGIQDQALSEGLHFVVPLKQHVTNVDTRVKRYTYDVEDKYVLTLDTQEVRVPLAINYRIADAPYVLQNIYGDPVHTITEISLLGEVRNVIGKFNLERIADKQAEINTRIAAALNPHFESLGLQVIDVRVLDVIPQRGIVAAIEEEKIEERKELTAEHRRNIAILDADAARETAKGTADALRTVAAAREEEQARLGMTGYEYVLFTNWDGVYPSTLVGDAVDILLTPPNTD